MLRFDGKQQNSVKQLSFNKRINFKKGTQLKQIENFMVLWVTLCTSNAGVWVDPWSGNRIPHTVNHSQENILIFQNLV